MFDFKVYIAAVTALAITVLVFILRCPRSVHGRFRLLQFIKKKREKFSIFHMFVFTTLAIALTNKYPENVYIKQTIAISRNLNML